MSNQEGFGHIVVLNGAPRSGKSSIAAAIQKMGDGIWMNLGVDGFMAMTPARCLPGIGLRPGGERPDLEPIILRLFFALYDSIADHSRMGINVVADLGHHDSYSQPMRILSGCAQRLEGLPALLVGIRCPAEVAVERRRATGWRPDLPDAEVLRRATAWEREVHRPGVYDLEMDTAKLSTEDCASAILRRLEEGPAPSAFQRLAGMHT